MEWNDRFESMFLLTPSSCQPHGIIPQPRQDTVLSQLPPLHLDLRILRHHHEQTPQFAQDLGIGLRRIGHAQVPLAQQLDEDDLEFAVGEKAPWAGVVAVAPREGFLGHGHEEVPVLLARHLAQAVEAEAVEFVRCLVFGRVVLRRECLRASGHLDCSRGEGESSAFGESVARGERHGLHDLAQGGNWGFPHVRTTSSVMTPQKGWKGESHWNSWTISNSPS